jgi:hypothetical protein
MDAHPVVKSAAASERTTAMAEMRRCIGSARFGIEAHDAPIEDFPKQPSQKDGLGRMCKAHWNVYTAGLARDAKARKAAPAATEPAAATAEGEATSEPEVPVAEPSPKRRRPKPVPVAEIDVVAG